MKIEKKECKSPKHIGARRIPVEMFSWTNKEQGIREPYCKQCKSQMLMEVRQRKAERIENDVAATIVSESFF